MTRLMIPLLTLSAVLLAGASSSAPSQQDPHIGKPVPTVTLQSSAGGTVKLPDALKGHWTLLYFYPKDMTPGCTKQACSYRDSQKRFQKLGVQIYGVSLDDIVSHQKFIHENHLNFPLLADTRHELSQALDVLHDGMLSRDTFLVGPDAKIREVWRGVDPRSTADETYHAVEKHVKEGAKSPSPQL